jgi:hypothetical protein
MIKRFCVGSAFFCVKDVLFLKNTSVEACVD